MGRPSAALTSRQLRDRQALAPRPAAQAPRTAAPEWPQWLQGARAARCLPAFLPPHQRSGACAASTPEARVARSRGAPPAPPPPPAACSPARAWLPAGTPVLGQAEARGGPEPPPPGAAGRAQSVAAAGGAGAQEEGARDHSEESPRRGGTHMRMDRTARSPKRALTTLRAVSTGCTEAAPVRGLVVLPALAAARVSR